MKKIIAFIPNALTLCNLLCGLASIFSAFTGSMKYALLFIIIAAVFDFLDGFAARLLKAYSDVGLQLDSLCDMVSFGVAPAFMLTLTSVMITSSVAPLWVAFIPVIIALGAAYRLAVFNVDTTQSTEFRGLPTPAMALFVGSLSAYIIPECGTTQLWSYLIPVIALLVTLLMVCRIPMFSFKFKDFSLKHNLLKYLFAIFSVIVVILLGIGLALSVIIASYITLSIVIWLTKKA